MSTPLDPEARIRALERHVFDLTSLLTAGRALHNILDPTNLYEVLIAMVDEKLDAGPLALFIGEVSGKGLSGKGQTFRAAGWRSGVGGRVSWLAPQAGRPSRSRRMRLLPSRVSHGSSTNMKGAKDFYFRKKERERICTEGLSLAALKIRN